MKANKSALKILTIHTYPDSSKGEKGKQGRETSRARINPTKAAKVLMLIAFCVNVNVDVVVDVVVDAVV